MRLHKSTYILLLLTPLLWLLLTAMLPAHPQILTCPTCGKTKLIMCLASGNTIGGIQWSDCKTNYPMMPRPSAVQQCPHCEHYFLLSRQEPTFAEDGYSSEKGELTFAQLTEAWKEAQEWNLTAEEETTFRLMIVWAYNDEYTRGDEEFQEYTPSEADKQFFRECALRLMDLDIDDLLKAELYRELGEFDTCHAILDSLQCEGFRDKVRSMILERCAEKNTTPFVIFK